MSLTKACKKCERILAVIDFNLCRGGADGRRTECKGCQAKARKIWYDNNKEKSAAYSKIYREINAGKLKVPTKEYSQNYQRQYREKNRERLRKRDAEYNKKNKEKMRAYYLDWYSKNRHLVVEESVRYREAKSRNTPCWITESHVAQMRSIYFDRQIVSEQSGLMHHVDHIIPLRGKNVCGLHVPWNMRIIPASENVRKSNRLMG